MTDVYAERPDAHWLELLRSVFQLALSSET
jgi:hypothetical protein